MNPLLIILIVLAALALVAVLFVVGLYNKLVGLRNRFKNAYAQIDVQLKRRYDLIPNLVETAKGYLFLRLKNYWKRNGPNGIGEQTMKEIGLQIKKTI